MSASNHQDAHSSANTHSNAHSKLSALRQSLQQQGLDGLWVSDSANIRALTDFSHAKDAKLLVTLDQAWLYTDSRYIVQARDESAVPAHIAHPPATYQHAAQWVAGGKIGVEGHSLTLSAFEQLKEHWQAELVVTHGLAEQTRLCKTPDEVQKIREAQALADRVFAEVRPMIVAGVRELDIALEIESRLRRAVAESAFDIIVASGPRGAMPHGVASERVIGNNELVTIDMGAKLDGYHSDMTRTVAVGQPDAELVRMYHAVLDAEQAAVQAVRAGVCTKDLDAIARNVLAEHDLAQYFAHSLGHGVGLEIHEGPRLGQKAEDVLQAGMIITIEPGVYIPDLGGVRIEDLLLVTEDGYEQLSQAPKEQLR